MELLLYLAQDSEDKGDEGGCHHPLSKRRYQHSSASLATAKSDEVKQKLRSHENVFKDYNITFLYLIEMDKDRKHIVIKPLGKIFL